MDSLDFEGQAAENASLVRALYTTKLKKVCQWRIYSLLALLLQYGKSGNLEKSFGKLEDEHKLSKDPDVMFARAETLYTQCRFKKCHELTQQ